jgi:hypothetical protein
MEGTMAGFAIKVAVPPDLSINYAALIVLAAKCPADTRFYLAQ